MPKNIQPVRIRTVTERLADYTLALRLEDVPASIVQKAKEHLIHHLGVACLGYGSNNGQQAVTLALELSGGEGRCTIIGDRRRADSLEAVFVNSFLMGHDGLDDFQLPAGVHPGIIIQPIAWAVGETAGASGREFLTAIIAGYDVMTKLCNPVWTWTIDPPRRPNSIFAPFGGAATASRLLNLSLEQTVHAFGHAGQAGMGIVEGSEYMWPMNPLLARSGLMATMLAKVGMPASATIIEGRHGVYQTYFQRDPESVKSSLETLGDEFELSRAEIKRHAASGLNVIPIELIQQLVRDHLLTPDCIATVDVVLPAERKPREEVWEEALAAPGAAATSRRGSLRFRIAAIIDGRIDPDQLEQAPDHGLRSILDKIRLRFEQGHPIRYARLEVTTTDGKRHVAGADSYATPSINWDEWLADSGRTVLPEDKLTRLVDLIRDLENVADIAEVTACFVPDARR